MLRLSPFGGRLARVLPALLLATCSDAKRDSANPSATTPEIASVGVTASASASAPIGDAAASKKSISRGRGLAEKKDWKGAVVAFERAASEDPGNGVAYSELGFAALLTNDVKKSLEASERALTFIDEPKLRAQILYNLGRAKEMNGDLQGARQALEQSLALRKNDIVSARLSSLGIKPAVPSAGDLPCSRTFANTASLCACVVDEPEGNSKAKCDLRRTPPKFRDGELEIVEVTSERLSVSLLAANAKGGLRVVARLGRNVEGEDATDLHEVISFEERKLSGRSLAIVRTKQRSSRAARPPSSDAVEVVYNLATYCVLRSETEETRCVGPFATNISRTVATKSGKPAEDTVELTHKLQGSTVDIKVDRGEPALVPDGMIGTHVLFASP